jgi:hypothetical protein
MEKTPKLIKDCKVGDTLYYVILKDGSTEDLIIPVSIEKIEGSDWFGVKPNVYKCKSIYGSDTYEFNHENSDTHDSLIVDTDYAYGKDDDGFKNNYKRFYTSYDAAVEWLMTEIKYDIIKKINRLERLEKNNGVKTNIFQKKTKECKVDYHPYKKIEIYDCSSWEKPEDIDKALENKKIKVYKKLIETDYYGDIKYSGTEIFVKEFDYVEDALEYIFEHDKSRWHGDLDSWYEGETYFIKED